MKRSKNPPKTPNQTPSQPEILVDSSEKIEPQNDYQEEPPDR